MIDTITAFRTEYVDAVGGDHLAALMLAQIIYWYRPGKDGKSKLRVYKPKTGKWWLVKSHVDWYDELRLTRRQSQRCLEVLRRHGIIETYNTLYAGHPTIHLRCTLIEGKTLPDELLGAFHCTLKDIPLHQDVQSITYTTTETTNNKVFGALCLPTAIPDLLSEVQIGNQDQKLKPPLPPLAAMEENVNATDILSQHTKTKQDALQATPTSCSTATLAFRWQQHVGAAGGFAKPFTGKELGQFKKLFKGVGAEGIPIIDYAFAHWDKFTKKVLGDKGLAVAPEQPNLGFLLQHYELCWQLIAKQSELDKPVSIPASKLAAIDKQPVICDTASPHQKATVEQIEETMALIKSLKKD